MATGRAASFRPGQFRHLICVASVTGRMPERLQAAGVWENVGTELGFLLWPLSYEHISLSHLVAR